MKHKKNIERIERSITGILPILRYAIDHGVKKESVLEGSGITETDLLDFQTKISLSQELKLIRNLIIYRPHPETAWELGRYFDASSHGTIGNMIAHAPTIGDIFHGLLEFFILSHSYLRLYSETVGKKIRVYLIAPHLPNDLLPFLLERDLASGFAVSRLRAHNFLEKFITGVSFSHAPRTDIELYKNQFIDNLAFNKPVSYFETDSNLLSMPLGNKDEYKFELYRQQCQAEFTLLNEKRFYLSDRVKLYIQSAGGKVGLEDVAKQMNMSERSLRRQLEEEGLSFSQIKNQYHLQQSLYLLRDRELGIDKIAELIGYSEACTFIRAFKKWTGLSPANYRKNKMKSLNS